MPSIHAHSRNNMPAAGRTRAAGFAISGIIILAAVFIIIPSCAFMPISGRNAVGLLPREVDVAGWRESGKPVWYSRKSIALFLGEKSPLYTQYNVREMAYADYSSISGEPREIRVSIFHMDSLLDAFGILSRERGFPDRHIPHIAALDDSYALPGGLYLRCGSYYITVTSLKGDAMAIENYIEFAHIISRNISDPRGTLPDYAALFGDHDYRNDVIYYTGGHPEVRFLKNVFCRRRMFDKKAATVFFARRRSPADALRDFSGYLHRKEVPMMLSRTTDYRTALGVRSEGRVVVVSVYREWLFGILDAETIADGDKNIRQLFGELTGFTARDGGKSGDDARDAE